ncbi:SA1362 family protein [Evansella tamaricis]|uniref:Uncharacterized protein n=1 Tax=Evansella tamaricis TaxID=2069301 RepID=A0ABS6JEY1_9BACI|nr:SA1362 family protein [Evansella tamaricis]MBU9712219.1 hypothetical protein [Evansella tamaricis]
MLRHSYHPLVLTIIGLAILGIGVSFISRPGAFITQILITIGIVAVMIILFKRFLIPWIMRRQSGLQQNGMYAQKSHAANSSKRPVPFPGKKKDKKKRITRPLVKRQSNVKLTVIEGKKNKKKNRALF